MRALLLTLLFSLALGFADAAAQASAKRAPSADGPADSTTYARAMAHYYAPRPAAARALLLRAAREYEAATLPDSAALALRRYGGTYVNARETEALKVAYADTLAPWLARLGTPLARAFDADLRGELGYWSFEWATAMAAYREAFAYMDTASALALPFAAANRRSLGFLQLSNAGVDSAIYFGHWSLRLAERAAPACSRDRGYAHYGLANFYQIAQDYERTVYHLHYATAALDAVLPPEHPNRATLYAMLAESEVDRGRFDDGLVAIRKAFAYLGDADASRAYTVATEYAAILHHLGLYEEALYWDRRAIDYAREGYGGTNGFLAAPTLSAAAAATYTGDTVLAAQLIDSVRAIIERYPEATSFVRADYHSARGSLALAREDLPGAREAYGESLRYSGDGEGGVGVFMFRASLHNLANVHLNLAREARRAGRDGTADLDRAADYLARLDTVLAEAGAEAGSSIYVMQHRRLGAQVATERGEYARAHALLSELYGELASAGGRGAYLALAFDLADAAVALADTSARAADAALLLDYAAVVERAIDEEYAFLGAERWDEDFTESLRRVFTTAAFATAERAAAASGPEADCLRERATRLADLPRALLLRRRGAEAVAARSTALPDSVANRGRRLRQRLYAVRHTEKDSAARERALADIRERIVVHEDELRRLYPAYYRALANPLRLDVPALRARAAREDACYVSYLADTAHARVLVTAVSGEDVGTYVLPFGAGEVARALSFKRDVALRRESSPDTLAADAGALYGALLAPVLGPDERALPERLVIASDGPLADLPFVALLAGDAPAGSSAAPDYGTWPWVGLLTSVSHVDALAMVGEDDGAPAPGFRIASIAPGFETGAGPGASVALGEDGGKRRKLLRTPWTLALTEELGERYGATVRTRGEATEAAFAEAYGTHDVLHLGTHALLNGERPLRSFFALAPEPRALAMAGDADGTPEGDGTAEGDGGADGGDGRLYAYEIYGLDGVARLAVLPACYSGAGAFSTAEGTLSLATALRNSGCASVVQSRWQLDDQQTSALLTHFYAALADGAPVDEALAAARRRFLAEAPAELRHPFYWAGLTAVGPSVSFGESRGFSPWWLLALVPVGLLGVYTFRRRAR